MSSSKQPAASGKRPPGFESIRDILDEKLRPWSMANVMGVVIDTQAPTPTQKEDWKCTIRIIDKSVDEDGEDRSIACHFFMSKEELPDAKCGDVLVLHQVKIQARYGEISLLTSFATKLSLFTAQNIPHPPADPSDARVEISVKRQKQLTPAELSHVPVLYHCINKDRLPTAEEYQKMVLQSRNVRDKFRELKDVEDGCFCNVIVQLVKEPFDLHDKITLWVSDYTENMSFYSIATSAANAAFEDGDPHGYLSKKKKSTAKTKTEDPRPSGKRSMQITCWEPHATAIREGKISEGTWVLIRNLQVKYGREHWNLEGYLREDREARGVKIGIQALDSTDREAMDPRHLSALRRHRDYLRTTKSQRKEIDEAAEAGKKRKSMGLSEEKPNSDARRKARRKAEQAARKKAAQEQAGQRAPEDPNATWEPEPVRNIPTPGLNSSVKCDNHNVAPTKITTILERVEFETDINGEAVHLTLPFVNVNHRVDVRVTDFWPSDLRDFVYPKKTSKFDVLSDNENSDLESGSEDIEMTDPTTKREWEWRFALELEDATPSPEPRARFWVVVDNMAAQCLTNLDATDLKRDAANLDALRQRMFYLWGNLEEQKSALVAQRAKAKRAAGGDLPPPDSSDDESENQPGKVTNRPFQCCVRQYGIKVRESNPANADAGKGWRWVRMFGLYGTRIAGV